MVDVIVVDEPSVARETSDACERRGFSTATVSAETVTLCDLEAASCVVTELAVDGTGPFDLAERIRREQPQTAVVVYTDEGSEAVASRAFTVGVDEYVRKSAGPVALVDSVERAIERRQRRRSPTAPFAEGDDLNRYRTIVETVDDMIYALDASGSVTLANRAFVGYFGLEPDELVGTDIAEVMPDAGYETGTQLIRTLLSTDETNRGRFDFQLERPDGSSRFLEVNVALVCDEDDEFRGSVGVVRDVTDRRERSQRLERQNERLEEFASIVGHDLRNPLNVIAGSVEAAREGNSGAQLDRIETCVDRMEAMLTDLLALAREGKRLDEVEVVSIGAVALDAWQTVETGDASLSLDEDLGHVQADRGRLRQCFENLFRNAVEHGSPSATARSRQDVVEYASEGAGSDSRQETVNYASEGARSDSRQETVEPDATGGDAQTLDCSVGDAERPSLTVTVEATHSGFAVRDDGPGIPPSEADRVFDRGYTTSRDGTGFGLSIVSRVVEAHGWSIRLDREFAEGARFVIET